MAQLFTLMYGKSKKRMHPIMIDQKYKCENYMNARGNVIGWHTIVPAIPGSIVWRQKSATIGGNKDDGGRSGYISKHGFNPHT